MLLIYTLKPDSMYKMFYLLFFRNILYTKHLFVALYRLVFKLFTHYYGVGSCERNENIYIILAVFAQYAFALGLLFRSYTILYYYYCNHRLFFESLPHHNCELIMYLLVNKYWVNILIDIKLVFSLIQLDC